VFLSLLYDSPSLIVSVTTRCRHGLGLTMGGCGHRLLKEKRLHASITARRSFFYTVAELLTQRLST
jgi:hypothetical protein